MFTLVQKSIETVTMIWFVPAIATMVANILFNNLEYYPEDGTISDCDTNLCRNRPNLTPFGTDIMLNDHWFMLWSFNH